VWGNSGVTGVLITLPVRTKC